MNWEITAATIGWLRYKQRCFLAFWERSPFGQSYMYRPDICGITRDRKVIEVEVKQTVADFKANAEKRGMQWREKGWAMDYPVRFYFAVTREIVDQVKPLLPTGAGLLTLAENFSTWGPEIEVVVGATHDKRASKLSPTEIGRLLMHQTASLHRATVALHRKKVLAL